MKPVVFEDQAPVTSLKEALRMLNTQNVRGTSNVESDIREDDTGPYISQGEMHDWPERLLWQKNYRLEKTVFDELRQKGYVRKTTPISWSITNAGTERIKTV